jgi:broad specificity phosphatase PhoE
VANIWGTEGEKGAPPRPRRLLLARHGVTGWNARHVWQGHRDVPLTDLGRTQARALAERVADEGIDAIWTSDLSRALETAQIVGERLGLEPRATELLREVDVGAWEGLAPADILEREPETVAALARGEDLPRGGTGETIAAFQERVVRGFDAACETVVGGTLLLVAHGGVNKTLLAYLLGMRKAHVGRLTSGGNASLSEVVFGEHGPQLLRLNDAHHTSGLERAPPHDSA